MASSCAFTGSIQRDDTGEVQAWSLSRGRHKEVGFRREKTGESNTTKVTSTNSYAKLTINGEVLAKWTLSTWWKFRTVDLMEAHRNALGL